MKRITTILLVVFMSIFAVTGTALALNAVIDTQAISQASTLSVDISTSATPNVLSLNIDGPKKNENIKDLADIVTARSDSISALSDAESITYKTAFIMQMGHAAYPPASGDFAQKVEFTATMDCFNKTFSARKFVFIPRGGMNALDDYVDTTEIVGVEAEYDAAAQTLVFSLDPAKDYLDVDGDTYVVVADVKKKLPTEGGSGGGCNAGFAGLPLIVCPLVSMRATVSLVLSSKQKPLWSRSKPYGTDEEKSVAEKTKKERSLPLIVSLV